MTAPSTVTFPFGVDNFTPLHEARWPGATYEHASFQFPASSARISPAATSSGVS